MRISLLEVQNIVLMISTRRLRVNKDSEACNSISQIGHLLVRNGLSETFRVRSPECRFDFKHHKAN